MGPRARATTSFGPCPRGATGGWQRRTVISFDFKGNAVRAVTVPELWWFLVDVCSVLGIGNSRDVARRLPDHCKSTVDSNDGGGGPDRSIINRSGLFRVLKQSRKAVARELFDWVTDEVLPTLDRTGAYVASRSGLDLLANVRQLVEPIRADLAALRDELFWLDGRNPAIVGLFRPSALGISRDRGRFAVPGAEDMSKLTPEQLLPPAALLARLGRGRKCRRSFRLSSGFC